MGRLAIGIVLSSIGWAQSGPVCTLPAEVRAAHSKDANALLGKDTPRAIELLNAELAEAPNLPWPHLQLVSVYSTPNFLDKAKAISHARAFLAACPAAIEGYASIGALGDKDLTREAAAQLRRVVEPRTDPAAIGAYSTLWPLEFAVRPPSEYDALRKQVADDVARLRKLNLENVREWWQALEDGYQLTHDEKQSNWAADENARRFPSKKKLPERTRWYAGHAYPGSDAPADKKNAYYSALLKETDAWIKQYPNAYPIWFDRLQALDELDDSPAAEVESCIAKMLAIAKAEKGSAPLDSVTDYQLLWVLYHKKLEPGLQLQLAQKGLEQRDVEFRQFVDDRYTSKKNIQEGTFWRTYWRFQAFFYEADAYTRLKQPGQARGAMEQAESSLRVLQPRINGNDEFRKAYAKQESFHWLAEARLAELQGQRVDAMAYYQSALLARLESDIVPAPGEKDDLAHDAHELWMSLGGSEESWKRWYTRRADTIAAQRHLRWENTEEPLPPFQLADLQGKMWRSADLKGKVVFLNFWASY